MKAVFRAFHCRAMDVLKIGRTTRWEKEVIATIPSGVIATLVGR
jgi:hypothetical protein